MSPYSCVHISLDSLFSKILKKPSIVQKKNDTSYEKQGFSLEKNKTKIHTKYPLFLVSSESWKRG